MTRDSLAVMGLFYTFYDSRFRFGLTTPTRHHYITSAYDIQKVISQETTPAWRCIRISGAYREGYVSAGCGSTGDSSGNSSFQLDSDGRFRGGARNALRALRGKVQLVSFSDIVLGDWVHDFADAVSAELPNIFVDFEEVDRKRAISIDTRKRDKKPEKKIEEAHRETGLLKSKLDQLSGKPVSATRMISRKMHTVSRGESLISIANKYYQNSSRWMEICNANKNAIGSNPNLLRVGMQLELP